MQKIKDCLIISGSKVRVLLGPPYKSLAGGRLGRYLSGLLLVKGVIVAIFVAIEQLFSSK